MWPFKRNRARELWARQLEIDATKEFVAEYPDWLAYQLRAANASHVVEHQYTFDMPYEGQFKIKVAGTEYWWLSVRDWINLKIELYKLSTDKENLEKADPRHVPLNHLFAVAAVLEKVTTHLFKRFPYARKYLSIVLK